MAKYYIAGPITGLPNFNQEAFEEAARVLRNIGLDVHQPFELKDFPEDHSKKPWTWYMRRGITELVKCHALILLPGWDESRGALTELRIAQSLGYPVYFYASGQLVLSRLGNQDETVLINKEHLEV